MQLLPIECSFCNWNGVVHLDRNHQNPKCEYCHQKFYSVETLNEHKVSKCEKILVNCLLKELGCYEQIHRCNLSNHYLSEQHRNSLMKILHQMKLQIENARKASTQMEIDPSGSTTVIAVDVDTILFQELCEILDIPLDDLNILNNDGQEQLNNALLQCQRQFPTLTLNFLKFRVSIEEDNSN
ncbi:unnamed protein product [Rotaria sp. Silwood2]|nr:unnamed protein product [Rotaria sp. Silwood2]CAF3151163.1 unnamed protein product [Rotaria sp. Silwood2]CAF3359188.1 unnamed protein product [Rotaria sp. Silwood2]CAF4493120.1 unnamed protein product [Rotaria sp. Silwood2]CAF4553066.1 unnamed protein product [Rotaria sp. Silwood2]